MNHPITANARVVLLGDSYTQNGMWHQQALHLLKKLDGAKKIKLFNCGIGGDKMDVARKRLDSDAARYKPTHLFILFGTNDSRYGCYTRADRAQFEATVADRLRVLAVYEEALRGIIADARVRGWIPIIGTPTRLPLSEDFPIDQAAVNEVIDMFADICRKVAAEEQLYCVDLNRRMAELTARWQGDVEHDLFIADHVHPTPMGYRLLGRAWLAELGYPVELPCSTAAFEAVAEEFDFYDQQRTEIAALQRSCAFIQYALTYWKGKSNLPEEDLIAYAIDWRDEPDLAEMWKRNIRTWLIWRHRTDELLTREELITEALVNAANT